MTQITQYYAKVGLSVDLSQLKKVDRYLALVEKKLRDFHKRANRKNGVFNINFTFNTGRLQFDVQRAFLDVSRRVRFPVDNFVVNRNALTTQITSAVRAAVSAANRNLTINPRVTPSIRQGTTGGGVSGRAAIGAGGAAGALARFGAVAGLGLGTGFGVNRLNQANQEAMSARLTTQAVVQAKGFSEQQGVEAFSWLRGLGNEVGFNYMDAAQDYNQFLSNALGSGLGIGQSQDIFKGFSEYQTAMGVTPARRKLVQNALSQMLGKGKVSMEELEFRLAV